jgi:hypothetical protein
MLGRHRDDDAQAIVICRWSMVDRQIVAVQRSQARGVRDSGAIDYGLAMIDRDAGVLK